MKTRLLIALTLASVLLPSFSSAENSSYAISLPDKIPGIVSQTVQKDKPAIVYINTVIRGTTRCPSFIMVPAGGSPIGGVVGSWQSQIETVTFAPNGYFNGTNMQSGPFGGTYSIQGNVLALNYAGPMPFSSQLPFNLAGNTLTIYNPQVGPVTYVRAGAQAQGADFVANAQNLELVRDTSPNAQMIKDTVTTGGSGTGFIVSPDGYIVTNAHVVFAGQNLKDALFNAAAGKLQDQLWAEASKLCNIPDDQKQKIVQILLIKAVNYFRQNGDITDISMDHIIYSGIVTPGEDLKIKSWPAVVKKEGTIYEKVGGEDTWGRDIAIIKVEKTNLPTVTLGDSKKVQVGDSIFVIGYPGIAGEYLFKQESMLEPTTTQGVISAKRTLKTGIETFQTDAAINHGNSGGPVYNDKGEVIGIATFGPEVSQTNIQSVGFLLAINHAKEFMQELNIKNDHGILDKIYSDGLNAFWRKDCGTTISKMKEVLTLYPGHPYAQYYINECESAVLTGKASRPINKLLLAVVLIIALGIIAFAASLFFKKKNLSQK